MWRASLPGPAQIEPLRAAREKYDLRPLAIHASYLINLASIDATIRQKSIDAFRGEVERAEAIGAEYLVIHPGVAKGCSIEDGIAHFASGVRDAIHALGRTRVTLLLENTAGAGGQIGSRFEELAALRQLVTTLTEMPTGYCLDTCHLLAAGFEIRTAAGLNRTLQQAEATLNLAHVHLLHANDSQGALGSRRDRHANIGEGEIGLAAFRRILTHPELRAKPFILETPVDEEGDDRRNVDKLKACASRR